MGKAQDEPQTIDLTSGSGKVILELPSSFDGTIEVETSYTKSFGRESRIESDWTLARDSITDWDGSGGQTPRRFVRAHATLGKGQSTVNGDIVLRRSKQ